MPLLGLGTDQVAKAMQEENNISAWHVDEFRGPDGRMLRANLDKTSDKVFRSSITILFMLPQSLKDNSDWMPVLSRVAKRDHLQLLCVDEAHCVKVQGDSFRPEVVEAM